MPSKKVGKMGGGRAARARTLSSSTTPWPHLRQAVPPVEGGQDRPRRALMARAAAPAAARQPGVRNRKARPLDICDGRRGRAVAARAACAVVAALVAVCHYFFFPSFFVVCLAALCEREADAMPVARGRRRV